MLTTGLTVALRKAWKTSALRLAHRMGRGHRKEVLQSGSLHVGNAQVPASAGTQQRLLSNASSAGEGKLQLISSSPPKFQKASSVGQMPTTKTEGAEKVGEGRQPGSCSWTVVWTPHTPF